MRIIVGIALLMCSLTSRACPSPSVPLKDFLEYYQQLFVGDVVGVNLTKSDLHLSQLDLPKGTITVTDSGPAYHVRVQPTKSLKGKLPAAGWLSVRMGCHTELPMVLEQGLFAIDKQGEVLAVYEHYNFSEDFNYVVILRDIEASLHAKR